MDFPNFLDYLIVDELVSEEEYEAKRRLREGRGAEDNISNSDH